MAGISTENLENNVKLSSEEGNENLECAVCLQQCVHPAELPCGHIFCFLCIKGVAFQIAKCPMCREQIPADYIYAPKLYKVNKVAAEKKMESSDENYQWYYEGGSGWWQYDSRASSEIEDAFNRGESSCQLLLAGFMYIIDFSNMVQYRQTNPARRRKIKRDHSITDKLGVAGLPETVLKNDMDEVATGMQRLLRDVDEDPLNDLSSVRDSDNPSSRFLRQDSENYGLESLGPEECAGEFDYRAVSPSTRDGRCFRPRLDLDESGDEESCGDSDGDENPLRIMSGPIGISVSPAAFRPLAMRSQGHDLSHETSDTPPKPTT